MYIYRVLPLLTYTPLSTHVWCYELQFPIVQQCAYVVFVVVFSRHYHIHPTHIRNASSNVNDINLYSIHAGLLRL